MQNTPFGEVRDQSALLREGDDPRMRFCVSRRVQNALLREALGQSALFREATPRLRR